MTDPGREITRLLHDVEAGRSEASAELLPLIYGELKKLARSRMAKVPAGNTLQPTALVHEAYLRLVGESDPGWSSRGHFFGAASRAMWQILVEQARSKSTRKRGGDLGRVDFDQIDFDQIELGLADASTGSSRDDILALDEALDELGRETRQGSVVMLRYVMGLTVEETATTLGVSVSTVEQDWRFAKVFLYKRLRGS